MASKKPATKRKPAAKKPPEPEIQVNRMTETVDAPTETTSPNELREEQGLEPVEEESQEERDAAGAARRERVLTPGRRGKEEVPEYEPQRQELENAGFDHHSAEKQRQAELQRERDAHNRRTGDSSL